MPKLTSLLLLQLIYCSVSAQHFSVANEKENVFYVWIDNPVSVAVENVPSSSLVVKTKNGTIKKYNDGYVYRSNSLVRKNVLQSQQYVRAELEGTDFDVRYQIDSFKVCIISGDTCQYTVKTNVSNKISEELNAAFHALKPGDTIIFKDIFAKGPDGNQIQLEPCILFVKEE